MVQAAGTLPIFLLAIPAGVLTDILDRRKFLIAVQLLLASVSVSLMVLAQTRMLSVSALIGLTFLGGIGAALMGPTWQAMPTWCRPTTGPSRSWPNRSPMIAVQF
jgi:MFS family permease